MSHPILSSPFLRVGGVTRVRTTFFGAVAFSAIVATTLWALWPGIHGPFLFDDFPNLENLKQLNGSISTRSLGRYLAAYYGNPGRPLSALSFLIEDFAWPSDPLAFKRDNLLFHLLAGVFLFGFVRSTARAWFITTREAEQRDDSTRALWIALIATTVWLTHPIQVSAVFLTVQRMTVLCGLFMFAGLWAYVALLQRARNMLAVFLALATLAVFTLLAFLCKENGALTPLYAWVLQATVLRQLLADKPARLRRFASWAIAMAALAPFVAFLIGPGEWLDFSDRDFTQTQRLLTQPRVLASYIREILIPHLANGSSIFHDDYLVSRDLWSPSTTLPAILGLGVLSAAGLCLRKRAPWISLAILWFLAGHTIESSFVALELYFEHRNYVPLAGVAMLTAWAITASRHRALFSLSLGAWLLLCLLITHQQAIVWGDKAKLARVWIHEDPDSPRAIQFMASYLFDIGDRDGARRVLSEGLRRHPHLEELAFQRALVDCTTTGLDENEISNLETRARRVRYVRVIADVISALRRETADGQCQKTLPKNAARRLAKALMQNPAYAAHRRTLAFLHYELAMLGLQERDLDEVMSEMDASYSYMPNPIVPREQALYLLSAGLPEAALRYIDLSDQTPLPAFKRWTMQMESWNAPLRSSAVSMCRRLSAQGKTLNCSKG